MTLGLWSYLTCAVLFVVMGITAGDFFSIASSVAFFAGALFFLLSHYTKDR